VLCTDEFLFTLYRGLSDASLTRAVQVIKVDSDPSVSDTAGRTAAATLRAVDIASAALIIVVGFPAFLHAFLAKVVYHECHDDPRLLAHSMLCGVCALFCRRSPSTHGRPHVQCTFFVRSVSLRRFVGSKLGLRARWLSKRCALLKFVTIWQASQGFFLMTGAAATAAAQGVC
jgi:hypothetical protein